jgi:hypothetical protein
MNQPIFITGVERSGSTMIAKILDICGAFKGTTTTMYENIELKELCEKYISSNVNGSLILDTKQLSIPVIWKEKIEKILNGCECYKDGPWMFKCSLLTQMWPVWHYAYPNAKWIIVRRRTGDIIESCMKTGYMRMFKEEASREKVNVTTEEDGWRWWIHQYESRFREMIETGVNCKIIWPERMVIGDYQQIYEMLDWVGLQWSSKIVETIDPLLNKSRRKEQWHT